MYDWIIEADIFRMSRELRDETDPAKQRRLRTLIQAKQQQLPNALALMWEFEPFEPRMGVARFR